MKKLQTIVFAIGMVTLICRGINAEVIHVPADYPVIQTAVDAAADGDTILVADGIYSGEGNRDITFNGKAVGIRSKNGPVNCIIDCQNLGRAFIFNAGEKEKSSIEGFSIRNGFSEEIGGAVYCLETSPILYNCVFSGNSANLGGAIGVAASTPHISGCLFVNNQATEYGGAMFVSNSTMSVINCFFADNASDNGGGIASVGSACTIINSDFLGNIAKHSGGALIDSTSDTVLTNCIIRGNLPDVFSKFHGSMNITYSNLDIPFLGEGNIYGDPLFLPGILGNNYLKPFTLDSKIFSPCLNKGLGNAADITFLTPEGHRSLAELTTDPNQVKDVGRVDMGFHYYQESGVQITMPSKYYKTGDSCFCTARLYNEMQDQISDYRLYVAMEIGGVFFFGPEFTTDFTYYDVKIPPGTSELSIIEEFIWPDTEDGGTIYWYGVLTEPDSDDPAGVWSVFDFSWGE